MSLQRQHFLLSYLETLSVGPVEVTFFGFKSSSFCFHPCSIQHLQTLLVKSPLELLGTVLLFQHILLIIFHLHFPLLCNRDVAKGWLPANFTGSKGN